MADNPEIPKFPLLTEVLAAKGLTLQAIYSIPDVANLFGVSDRTIRDRTSSGTLAARDLPGKGKFLSSDLEAYFEKRNTKGRK